MTDRVPGAPGQYQAVITAEQQQKLLAAEPFSITLTRDDQPIVEGTPFCKETVLPDSVVSALGLYYYDPTPADALMALSQRQVESNVYPGCFYRNVGNEQEWLNPPMMEREEYRTTERYNGQPVYVKRMNLGAIESGTQSQTAYTRISTGVDARCILSWHATVRRQRYQTDSGMYSAMLLDQFPYVMTSETKASAKIFFEYGSVVIAANGDLSDVAEVNLWIKYIKDPVRE